MRNFYLTFALVIGVFFQLSAFTFSWTGAAGTTDWNDPNNWDAGGVPGVGDDVIISGSSAVVDFTGASTVASIEVQSGGTLNIVAGSTLTLDGNTGSNNAGFTAPAGTNNGALDLSSSSGTVINNGSLIITNSANDGISSKGNFINNGSISIDTVDDDGITVNNGTFTNGAAGTLVITNAGDDYIYLDDSSGVGGVFTNDGILDILMTTGDDGISMKDGSIFNNNGTTNITATGGDMGILLDDGNAAGTTFNNAGALNITGTADDSIFVEPGTIFNNNAGGDILITDSGDHGTEVQGTFNNNAGSTYKAVNSTDDGFRVRSSGTGINNGTITIDGFGSESLENEGSFTYGAGIINIGCAATITEFEMKCDNDLGASCVNFDIFGLAGAGSAGGNDLIENFGGSASGCNGILDVSAATAKINWGTFVPAPGDCFTIVDGSGVVAGAGLFGTITSAYQLTQTSENGATEIEICVVSAVLSVDLAKFEAQKTERGSQLSWETHSEENNEGFNVERSVDGQSWSTLNFVRGNGNSSVANSYDYLDSNPADGTNYYRLKQLDFDGKFSYSNTVSLDYKNTTTDTNTVSVYPNPVNDVLFIDMDQDAEIIEVQLFDYAGKLLYSSNSAINQIPFGSYESGIYILKVRNGATQIMQKIIK